MPLNFLDELSPKKPNIDEILAEPPSESFLTTLSKPFTFLLDVLDTPGSVVRGLLAGEPDRAFGGILDPSQRVSGQELIGEKDNSSIWATLGGIGASIVTDPLLFTSSLVGFTKTGRALLEGSEWLKKFNATTALAESGNEAAGIALKEMTKSAFYKQLQEGTLEYMGKEAIRQEGLKGLGFSLPFSSAEYVPKSFNKTVAKIVDKVGDSEAYQSILAPTVGMGQKALKFLFNTKAETIEAQTIHDVTNISKDMQIREAKNVGTKLEQSIEEAAKRLDKPIEELRAGTTKAAEAIGFDGEGNFIPQQIRTSVEEYKTNRLSRLEATVDKVKSTWSSKLTAEEREILGNDPDAVSGLYKEMNDQINMHVGKANKDIQRYTDKADQIIAKHNTKLGLIVSEAGSFPEQFLTSVKEAGMDPATLLLNEKKSFVPVEALEDIAQHYTPRIKTEYGRTFFIQNEKASQAYKEVMTDKLVNGVNAGFTKSRTFREMDLQELNNYFKKTFGAKGDVFSTNPTDIFVSRKIASETAIANAQAVNTTVSLAGEKILGKVKEGYVHLADFLENSKLTGFRNPITGEEVSWGLKAPKEMTRNNQIRNALSTIGLGDIQLPQSFIDDVFKVEKFRNHPAIETFFREFVDPINSLYRSFLTAVPAFVSQNVLSNGWSNWMAGVKHSAVIEGTKMIMKDYIENHPDHVLTPLFKKMNLGELTDAERLMLKEGIPFSRAAKNIITETADIGQTGPRSLVRPDNVGLPSQLIRQLEKVPGFKGTIGLTTEINRFAEESAKFGHYLSKRLDGLDPLAAGESVKKYLFDYTDLTDFEKLVGRRGVLFYTFMRKNIPLALTETFYNKRAYVAAESIARASADRVEPEYLTNQGYVPLGDRTFVNPKMPFFEANQFAGKGRVIDALSPVLRTPLSDKPFSQNLPISRHLTLVKKFLDEGSQSSPIGQLMGINVVDVDPAQAKLNKAKEYLKKKIASDSDVVKYESYFVPKGIEKKPETDRYLKILNELR